MKDFWFVTKLSLRKYKPTAIYYLVFINVMAILSVPSVSPVMRWILVFALFVTYLGAAVEALNKENKDEIAELKFRISAHLNNSEE